MATALTTDVGLRLYDWARLLLGHANNSTWDHWLLVRRNQQPPYSHDYYFVFAPAGTELAGVAGLRWIIEECFQRAKDDLGLDHCEARSWHSWKRHMNLVMAALAFLDKLSAELRCSAWGKPNKTSPRAIAA
jgi:SRSO17 transposase